MIAQSLDDVLSSVQTDTHSFTFQIPAGWMQGKAVFGGLVIGGLARAMTTALGQPERRLRSLTAELIGSPAIGPAQITTRLLRASNTVSTLTAELSQNGTILTHATGIFGSARAVPGAWTNLERPIVPPFEKVDPLPMDVPFAPEFTSNFEYRPTGGLPFSGQLVEGPLGWLKARAPAKIYDEAYVAALVDAWWLAVIVAFESPRPAATLGFSLDFCAAPEDLLSGGPLIHRGKTLHLHEGYSSETRELWTAEGKLLSLNRQLVCVIK